MIIPPRHKFPGILRWLQTIPCKATNDFFSSRIVNALFISTIIALTFYLYRNSLTLSWIHTDDLVILLQAHYFTPFEYFFDPDKYTVLTDASLTPWITLSFDMDLSIFGTSPSGFYAHQLLSVSLLMIITYLFLSKRTDKITAFLCTVLFMLMAPTATFPYYLPGRHYLEGLILSIISLHYYLESRTSIHPHIHLAVSAIFYLLAITAKEVYVPLVLFYLAWEQGPFINRGKRLIPYVAIVLGYIVWRWSMLGVALGGYGHPTFIGDILSNVPAHLKNILYLGQQMNHALFRSSASGLVLLCVFTTLITLFLIRNPKKIPQLSIITLALIGPILPVVFVIMLYGIDNLLRYFFFIGWGISVGLGLLIGIITSYRRRIMLQVLITICLCAQFIDSASFSDDYYQKKKPKWQIAQFVLQQSDDILINPGKNGFIKKYIAAAAHLKDITTSTPSPYISDDPLIFYAEEKIERAYVRRGFNFVEDKNYSKNSKLTERQNIEIDMDYTPYVKEEPNAISWSTETLEGQDQFVIIYDHRRSFSHKMNTPEGRIGGINHLFFIYNFQEPTYVSFVRVTENQQRIYSPPTILKPSLWQQM